MSAAKSARVRSRLAGRIALPNRHQSIALAASVLVAAGLFAVLSVPQEASAQNAAAPDASTQYVGSNVCRTCHNGLYSNFTSNPHYKSIAAGNLPPEQTGCESCHGPGGGHIRAGGGSATIPNAFSRMQPDQVLATCLNCHSQQVPRANIRRSEHTLSDVVCNNCHSVHSSPTPTKLLAKQQTDLCYGCHTSVRAQFSMPFKHRVNEGAVQCVDCHNPHGSFAATWSMAARPRMVGQRLGNEEPCLSCHTDKRGPFVYEHEAVRVDGCETCHLPHGSTNSRMLKRPVVFTLCLECHTGVGDFGRQTTGIPRNGRHDMADPRRQNCTLCHVQIHGSNSDAAFRR